MEKNTIIAIILSALVVIGSMTITQIFFPPDPVAADPVATPTADAASGEKVTLLPNTPLPEALPLPGQLSPSDEKIPPRTIKAETELFEITLSNRGGVLESLKLKKHEEDGVPLEMILVGDEEIGAFDLLLGGPDAPRIDEYFNFRQIDSERFEFYREFSIMDGVSDVTPFVIRKIYRFKPNDYLIELRIVIENSVNRAPPLSNDGYAYTLRFGPQIGPSFDKLDGRYAYRNYYTFSEKKAAKVKVKGKYTMVDGRFSWVAIAGKYFTAIGIPDEVSYDIGFSNAPVPGVVESSQIFFSRPLIRNVSRSEDVFFFYLGPKTNSALRKYDRTESNGFGLGGMSLEEVVDTSSILGWLEFLLSKLLILFYAVIPNYGVAIILVTVVIKAIFFPFTRKSSESTAKMASLSPQINELKAKYKERPDLLNKAMAELYKKEGVNPMGGCLPLLVQMPFFFAMYGLFNKYFEFRGAVFIPGWIEDLSIPEAIYTFSNGFTLPLLGWDAIRLLPILFVGTQLLYSKLMQPSTGQSNSQMKMMNVMMPLLFFFILYNAPSGLLIYWIASNVITGIQQVVTNELKKRKANS